MKEIKSRTRVNKFGEVNTSITEINSMYDCVKNVTNKFESKILEPACGDGNFLVEILNRKIHKLKYNFSSNKSDFEKYLIVIISSLYGIDIQKDNIKVTRNRLFYKTQKEYKDIFKHSLNKNLIKSIKFVIKNNIIHGDGITFRQIFLKKKPVTFCDWILHKDKIKRKDYQFPDLFELNTKKKKSSIINSFKQIEPKLIKEFKPVNFDKVYEAC